MPRRSPVGCRRAPAFAGGLWCGSSSAGGPATPFRTCVGSGVVGGRGSPSLTRLSYRCLRNRRPSKPYEFIGVGEIDVTKLYKFIGFGDIHGPKPYKFIGLRWAFISQTPVSHSLKVLDRGRNTPKPVRNRSESIRAASRAPCRIFRAWFGPALGPNLGRNRRFPAGS